MLRKKWYKDKFGIIRGRIFWRTTYQNPLKSPLGKKSYGRLKFHANIVQQGINIQNFKFHVSDYNLRCTPHILILFFAHGYAHVYVLICTLVTMTTTTIISRFVC